MRNANSDNRREDKRSERQVREAGKFPYHRYDRLIKNEEQLKANTRIKK